MNTTAEQFRVLQEMDKIDIRILLDEVITIEDDFYLVGRRDKTERDRQSFKQLMSTVDKSMPVIAMDHQPFELKQAARCRFIIIRSYAPRTNGAQSYCNEKNVRARLGIRTKGAFHAIVSSDLDFGAPLRLGSRSEIVQVEVTFE